MSVWWSHVRTTRSVGRNSINQSSSGDIEEEEEEDDGGLVHGRRRRKVQFMPSVDTTHTIYYRGHWLRITRTKRYPDYGHGASLKISVVARNNDVLKKLVLEAKREYEKDSEHRVHIFIACWSHKMENPEYTLAMLNNLYGDNALKVPFRLDRTDRPGRPYSVISYGTIQDQGKSRLVVLKTYRQINGTTIQKVSQRTYREVKILVALHDPPGLCPNINRFYGVLFPDPAQIREAIVGIPSIVVDFVKYDSLEYTEGKDFGLRLSIVQQLGNGLLYMHSLGLVHGDLKPDNFRVTEDGVVKIIDFGLGRYETNEHTGLTTLILPCYRFTAPELIIPHMDAVSMFVTKATDIYAFSMTALQILDGQGYQRSIPFNQHWVPFAVRRAIVNQEWPQAQHYTGVIPEAWGVISACWTTDPTVRPSIDIILKQLSGIPLSL